MKKIPVPRMALGAAAALLGLVIAPVLTASGASAAPAGGGGGGYTCTGGNVPAGTYKSLLITGVCFAPAGTIVVRGNVTIAPGALLDAVTPGDPPGHPVVPATVLIRGDVFVGKNAVLALGCSPNISCSNPPGISFDRVGGNITALGSEAVVIHSATIGGNVTVLGGGGGVVGGPNSGGCFSPTAPIPAPWSEAPGLVGSPPNTTPQYTDVEESSIGGNLTVAGQGTCWLGSFRNQVRGSLTFAGNVTSDPDGMEINNNLLGGNIVCLRNNPAVQYGDAGSAPNLVGGFAVGECGFGVVKPNPAPSPGPPPVPAGPLVHISVSQRSLNTYAGTFTATHVASLPPVTTVSGYKITADLYNFTLAGGGLTGTGTESSPPNPQGPGAALLATVYPDGSRSFIAYVTCNPDQCRLGKTRGTTMIRFYGTTTPRGLTYGTFLVVAGGAQAGGLAKLAGWGTFTSAGQPAGTWRLVEHLRIT
ncbi:MAG: hypothetical protein JO037_18285 [Actinobacteria bacterium]|nr:hypothetical protein [Actinomycetota bacterium]